MNGLTPHRVLEELIYVGMGNIAELFDVGGNLRPIHEIPVHPRRMIAGVDVVKRNLTTGDGRLDEIRKVELWSKVEALDRLAQHWGCGRKWTSH